MLLSCPERPLPVPATPKLWPVFWFSSSQIPRPPPRLRAPTDPGMEKDTVQVKGKREEASSPAPGPRVLVSAVSPLVLAQAFPHVVQGTAFWLLSSKG